MALVALSALTLACFAGLRWLGRADDWESHPSYTPCSVPWTWKE